MKLKALLAAMLVAGIASSFAVASPPPGRGKAPDRETSTSTTLRERPAKHRGQDAARGRRPVVMLVLSGQFVSSSTGSFAMLVKHSNKHARLLRNKQVTVKVDARTKFRRKGKATLADLAEGDRLHVLVRARKDADSNALELLAKLVHARPAAPARGADADDEDDGGTKTVVTNTGTTATTS